MALYDFSSNRSITFSNFFLADADNSGQIFLSAINSSQATSTSVRARINPYSEKIGESSATRAA